jgi:hypothetical protein
MTDLQEKAMRMALKTLDSLDLHDGQLWFSECDPEWFDSVTTALRQALAQPEQEPEQEPVAWVDAKPEGYDFHGLQEVPFGKHYLYTAPPSIEDAVLAEREACAKLCEVEATVIVTNTSEQYQEGRSMGATVCAAAIRARSEK